MIPSLALYPHTCPCRGICTVSGPLSGSASRMQNPQEVPSSVQELQLTRWMLNVPVGVILTQIIRVIYRTLFEKLFHSKLITYVKVLFILWQALPGDWRVTQVLGQTHTINGLPINFLLKTLLIVCMPDMAIVSLICDNHSQVNHSNSKALPTIQWPETGIICRSGSPPQTGDKCPLYKRCLDNCPWGLFLQHLPVIKSEVFIQRMGLLLSPEALTEFLVVVV